MTTLKRKVVPFLQAAGAAEAPPTEPTAVVTKAAAKRKPAVDADPAGQAERERQGRLIEDVYEALMALGHNPVEARTLLDGLLSCGKPFRVLDEAITLIYSRG